MKVKSIAAIIFIAFFLLIFSPMLMAGENKLEIRDSDTITDVLQRNIGKNVELKLVSGDTLRGKVAKVTQHVVHVSKLTGKEFYDAIVRKDNISAVIIRIRGN